MDPKPLKPKKPVLTDKLDAELGGKLVEGLTDKLGKKAKRAAAEAEDAERRSRRQR